MSRRSIAAEGDDSRGLLPGRQQAAGGKREMPIHGDALTPEHAALDELTSLNIKINGIDLS